MRCYRLERKDTTVDRIKDFLKSPYSLIALMLIKLMTYYQLIDVKIYKNPMVIGSIMVLLLLFYSFAISKWRGKNIVFALLYTGLTILMFSDTMYYNYYHQTVSIKQLWQAANVAKVKDSFIATLIPASFILIVEIPFVYYYLRRFGKTWCEQYSISKKFVKRAGWVVWACVLFMAINPLGSKMLRKINSVEFFTNHINDVYYSMREKVVEESVPEEEVMNQLELNTPEIETNHYEGIAEGKNLIVIQLESVQNFVIGTSYHGQEITPNINKLLGNDSLYYDHYYSNIGKGNTVDAEFSSMNSLYPVIDREVYSLYQENTFNGLPWILRNQGYETMAIHGYEAEFWNRENAYPYQGFQEFYSQEDLVSDDVIGLGISDKSMFKQTVDILKKQEEPYFSFIVTLTNHHPYILSEELSHIKLAEEDEGTAFGNYLQTVHYTDEAIGEFIEKLKEEGLYEDTVIVLYGDHHGLNSTMEENNTTVSRFLGYDYDFDQMFRVPLIIHVPGSGVNETISTVGGQIDFLPTITNLFGIEMDNQFVLGQDLTNAKEGFVAFTVYLFEGSFVKDDVMFELSREGLFEGSRAWNIDTHEEVPIDDLYPYYEKALSLKATSKNILDQNLVKRDSSTTQE